MAGDTVPGFPRTFVIPAEGGQRLDRFLAQALAPLEVSRTAVQRAIRAGLVRVDGRPGKGGERAAPGARIELLGLPAPELVPLQPEPCPLVIVYEDDDLVVVDKPRGMVVHPAPGSRHGTLVHALLARYGSLEGMSSPAGGGVSTAWCGEGRATAPPGGGRGVGGEGRVARGGGSWSAEAKARPDVGPVQGTDDVRPGTDPRPGIVHRLDKDTTGLLLVARTVAAGAALRRQIAAREVRREYLGIARGLPPERWTVDAPIGRAADRQRMAVVTGGRAAVTHGTVLERFAGVPPYALVALRLETGRTHQIRVHLSAAGYPLAGDRVYGQPEQDAAAGLRLAGQALHAFRLQLRHPVTGVALCLEADPPADFRVALDVLRMRPAR